MITYLSLVIGELVPKRIALNAPERIATTVVRPMRLLSLLASPLKPFSACFACAHPLNRL
jgi:putative hemolysin